MRSRSLASTRAQGERLVEAGKVRVSEAIVRSQSSHVRPEHDVIEVDGTRVSDSSAWRSDDWRSAISRRARGECCADEVELFSTETRTGTRAAQLTQLSP